MERRLRIRAAFEPTRLSAERLRAAYESLLPVAQRPIARAAAAAEHAALERREPRDVNEEVKR